MADSNNNSNGYYGGSNENQLTTNFSFQDLLLMIVHKWYWFLFSLAFFLGLAILYLLVTPPTYTRKMSVLIKDRDNSSLASEFSTFSSVGPGMKRANIHNEMLTIKSPEYVKSVVDSLNLDMNYTVKGAFHDNVLYGKDLPIQVILADVTPTQSASLSVTLLKDGALELSGFTKKDDQSQGGGKPKPSDKKVKTRLGAMVNTPIGKVCVSPSPSYQGDYGKTINVSHSTTRNAIARTVANISVDLNDDKSSVIEISYSDQSIERAEDVLHQLFAVYKANYVKQIEEQATATIKFIDTELQFIESNLDDVDSKVSNYKSDHQMPDLTIASNIYMNKAEQTSSELLALKNQLYMAKYIKGQLTGEANRHKVLPANSGINNQMVSQQIMAYNDKLMQRSNLVANSSVNNPYVVDLDQQLAAMRQAIQAALDNEIVTLQDHISALQGSASNTESKLVSNPKLEKDLLSVERKQKVREQQYMFLLQKKEENQLSKAFTTPNCRKLSDPTGSFRPTKPVKMNVLVLASIAGLLIPVIVLLLINMMRTTVRGRKDLEVLSIPFIGEIPLSYRKYNGLLSIFNRRKEKREIVVKDQSGNVINEAFRVVRTNLEFISGREGKNKVVMFTSSNPGSGKTFISANLAASFAVKGKHVAHIDLDMRKASSSSLVGSPKKGVSDYLSERVDDLDSLLVKGTINPNLDFLPVGTIPPNPTELLFGNRFEELIKEMRKRYDLILIDCPPVEIVADATIINKFCDITIYVIRSGVMERSMLAEVEKYYTDGRYKNMAVILNGTNKENSGYGRYGYTYGYAKRN